ncbi:hypothetical protein TVAG_122520 [Trichomonas vaginalis G3]|uniref:Uncharacterized protein n=1 Tax=Trichomonas vaginalis (strain ATCC PRA-98 / G3) TaxID=412133 RepID=A2DN09_TRIV3|nr:hypothetical protein TVAGG3_1010630 [Trichomonas vaginalis G3]EAY18186.1 hypothetical protein TVAG_122520 [Trichomonas vaginalis G3]KAI5491482.1 hypothetical protein TVAGG3_1010630 [Trichomonas vaginalis G3]|eukprot:XP_001579172.1 hypothetical protein [Trichomonas vaginalis G3]
MHSILDNYLNVYDNCTQILNRHFLSHLYDHISSIQEIIKFNCNKYLFCETSFRSISFAVNIDDENFNQIAYIYIKHKRTNVYDIISLKLETATKRDDIINFLVTDSQEEFRKHKFKYLDVFLNHKLNIQVATVVPLFNAIMKNTSPYKEKHRLYFVYTQKTEKNFNMTFIALEQIDENGERGEPFYCNATNIYKLSEVKFTQSWIPLNKYEYYLYSFIQPYLATNEETKTHKNCKYQQIPDNHLKID